ncbi:MAG: ArsR/SmtB family transcription factor [Halobacteriota archaeon]
MEGTTDSITREGADACCGVDRHGRPDEEIAADVRMLSALSNRTRYEALRHIEASAGDVCVCDLPPLLGVQQGTVSNALGRLHEAGLLTRRKEGRWRYYGLTESAQKLLDTLDSIREDAHAE